MNNKCIKELYVEYGLVDIQSLHPSIKSDIRYATKNNFTGKILYTEDNGLFCIPALAEAIGNAQRELININPTLSLVVFDAARPLSIQRDMFELVKGTDAERYIANPYGEYAGGFHNYGMALDVAIVDNNGRMLDFGTEYDSFEEIAHSGREAELVKAKKLSITAYENRMLLYYVMGKNGMLPYEWEWWHFQLDYDEYNKSNYKLLDF